MPYRRPISGLYAFGILAFVLAALSVLDMYLPRPYDGVILDTDSPGGIRVRRVETGSGAEIAGIRPGDLILGMDRSLLNSPEQAAETLNRYRIGEFVSYLVKRPRGLDGDLSFRLPDPALDRPFEVEVELGRRQIGTTGYLFACLLGGGFFAIGFFVLKQQPALRVSQVFFVLCTLFLLILVCRLRPASYSEIDNLVLSTGTAALVLLPASFLHLFLIFPRPIWDGRWGPRLAALGGRWSWPLLLSSLYLLPVAVLAGSLWWTRQPGAAPRLISGAPAANWWLVAAFVPIGLGVLAANATRLPSRRERRGAGWVLFGSLAGLGPFLLAAVVVPSFLETERFLNWGLVPLALIPLTFSYAIIRFQLMNVRVILRKSLLYTLTTALVTGLYALGIASFNAVFRGTELAASPYFPLVFALAIVLLFEPLRRSVQVPVDRFFFADRTRLQRTLVEMGAAYADRVDPAVVVHDLVRRLPDLLGLRFSALYLFEDDDLVRADGPAELPDRFPLPALLYRHLRGHRVLARMHDLASVRRQDAAAAQLLDDLALAGVEGIGALATSRRRVGLVLLSGPNGQTPLEEEDWTLLRGLLNQAAIALETSILLEERARQAEIERDLEIASAIQRSLLPDAVTLDASWQVAAACHPARHIGGDFYAVIPGPAPAGKAVIYGDVSGKSVPGALMMMAAKEVLHSLALANHDPNDLFDLANARLYELGQRSFVSLGYLTPCRDGHGLRYLLAGQPQPLKRALGGEIETLPLADHRLPLGALRSKGYRSLEVGLQPGEILLVYSDGVLDARAPDGEFFGVQRLAEVLAASAAEPEAVVASVLAALADFTRGEEPYDDLTVLALGRSREETTRTRPT
ncbi:MAG: SpoIIE family protein phosphatase [Acidobacteriota bacterium]